MIHLGSVKYDKYGTPILKNSDIESFSEAVISDFDKSILENPIVFPFERFIEYYLGLTLIYQDIYYEKNSNQILGITIFEDGFIKIFDKDKMGISVLPVKANTIVLDNSLRKKGQEGRHLFTALHEASHFLLHPIVFHVDGANGQKSQVISVHTENGGIWHNKWKEHQADYLASCLALPNKTFIPYINDTLCDFGIEGGEVVYENRGDYNHFIATRVLPKSITMVYGVSRPVAEIKLKKLKILRRSFYIRPTYEETLLIEKHILGQ